MHSPGSTSLDPGTWYFPAGGVGAGAGAGGDATRVGPVAGAGAGAGVGAVDGLPAPRFLC